MTNPSVEHARLVNEIRYAERLRQRTARLYRRLQAVGVFGAVVAGSATMTALSQRVPDWVSLGGGLGFAMVGALLLSIRPADKATANDADMRRYAKLRADARAMDVATLQAALDRARETDTSEVEPLRDVAWNDVVREIGAGHCAVALRWHQRMLATLA